MTHALLACIMSVAVPSGIAAQAQPRARAAAPVTMTVQVTDQRGNPVPEAAVALSGGLTRSGATNPEGQIEFRNIAAGTYRLRFEHKQFITLEREVVVRAGQPAMVAVTLNAAPAPPPAPPPPVQQPVPTATSGRTYDPRTVSITDFLEKNYNQKSSLLGCAEGATARLLQVRDPVESQQHADADELIYVVAGDGTIRIGDRDTQVAAGFFVLVPRGGPYNIRRQGRNPLVLLSVRAGEGCDR